MLHIKSPLDFFITLLYFIKISAPVLIKYWAVEEAENFWQLNRRSFYANMQIVAVKLEQSLSNKRSF